MPKFEGFFRLIGNRTTKLSRLPYSKTRSAIKSNSSLPVISQSQNEQQFVPPKSSQKEQVVAQHHAAPRPRPPLKRTESGSTCSSGEGISVARLRQVFRSRRSLSADAKETSGDGGDAAAAAAAVTINSHDAPTRVATGNACAGINASEGSGGHVRREVVADSADDAGAVRKGSEDHESTSASA